MTRKFCCRGLRCHDRVDTFIQRNSKSEYGNGSLIAHDLWLIKIAHRRSSCESYKQMPPDWWVTFLTGESGCSSCCDKTWNCNRQWWFIYWGIHWRDECTLSIHRRRHSFRCTHAPKFTGGGCVVRTRSDGRTDSLQVKPKWQAIDQHHRQCGDDFDIRQMHFRHFL